jgi:hypothetical protein
MALKIIGSGFGRTGTASLKRALEALDFGPCHHMEEVFANPAQVPHWQAVAAGKPVNWDEVFAGYRSQVDWPGAHVWRELAAAYPHAKVIHTERPEEQWWKSFSATIGVLLADIQQGAGERPPHIQNMFEAAYQMICVQTMGGSANREAALAAYRRRAQDVRATIAPERLLVFDVAQGWEPLCRFLDVPVPNQPFPRVNSTEEFFQMVKDPRP